MPAGCCQLAMFGVMATARFVAIHDKCCYPDGAEGCTQNERCTYAKLLHRRREGKRRCCASRQSCRCHLAGECTISIRAEQIEGQAALRDAVDARPEPEADREGDRAGEPVARQRQNDNAEDHEGRREHGKAGRCEACAEDHVDETAQNLRRAEQRADDHGGASEAERSQHRHHMRQHRAKREAQQREGRRHDEHRAAAALSRDGADDGFAHRSLPARRGNLALSHDPQMERHADGKIEPGIDDVDFPPREIAEQRRSNRPEDRGGKSRDQGKVGDAA